MNFSYFLLQIIPGLNNTIPGVESSYLPEQAAAAAAKLFEKTYADAWIIFGLLLFISLAFSVISKYVDLGEEWNIVQALKRIGTIAVLLVGFKFLFGSIFIINHSVSLRIFGEDNVSELNKQFEKIATNEQENKGVTNDANENPISRLFTMLGQITSDIVVDTLAAMIAFIFFVSTVLMHMLWRIAVIILFVTGPLLIALSLFPGFGIKILTALFGAIIQVAGWQVWFAICAFFVQTSDNTDLLKFTVGNTKAATANHIESVVFALIFTILYIGTPLIMNLFLPISAFSGGLVGALKAGGFPVKAAIGAGVGLASAGVGTVLGGAGGLLGAAGKLFSREGGGGSAISGLSGGAKPSIDRGTGAKGLDVGTGGGRDGSGRNGGGNDTSSGGAVPSDGGDGGGGGRTASSSEALQDGRGRKFNGEKVGRQREQRQQRQSSGTSPNGNSRSTSTVGGNRARTSGERAISGLGGRIAGQLGGSFIDRGSSNRGTSVSSSSPISNISSSSESGSTSTNGGGTVDRNNSGSTPSSNTLSSPSASQSPSSTPSSINRGSNDSSVSASSTGSRTSGVESGSSNTIASSSTPSVIGRGSNDSSVSPNSVGSVGSVASRTSGVETASSNTIAGNRSTPNAGGVVDRNSSGSTPSSGQNASSINRADIDRASIGNSNSNSNSNLGNKNSMPESRTNSTPSSNRSTPNRDSIGDRNSGLGSSASSNPITSTSQSSNPANSTNSSASPSSTPVSSNRSTPTQSGGINRNSDSASSRSSNVNRNNSLSSSSSPSSVSSPRTPTSPIITQIGSSISRGSTSNLANSSSNARSVMPSLNRGNMRFVKLSDRQDKPTDEA